MKSKCPVCKTQLEIDFNECEVGDSVDCPECGEFLLVEVKGGEYRLVTDKEKKFEEMEEMDEFDCEED